MRFNAFILCLFISIGAVAQHKGYADHTREIAKAESGHYLMHHEGYSRTGENFDVVYSRFYWEIDPAVLFIKGSVTSIFKPVVAELSELEFELINSMTIDSIIFRNEKVAWEYYSDYQFQVGLGEAIPQNQIDSVTIFYHGIPEQENGFGSFAIGQHNEVPVMWTLSEPYGASDWWPGKNDLADKIDSLDIFVRTPSEYRAASLGLLNSEVVEGNFRICHWKHRYPVVSYLVAVAVTNYVEFVQYAVVGGDSIPIVNYVYPEDSAQAASDSQNTAEMIMLFDSLFGSYPFADEKYGHAQWSRGGGMEHQTMSFMQGFGHDLRAHELAHSWFGNKVTLGTWQDIFLNEGFATYLTGLSFEHMYEGFYWDIWKSNTRLAASDGADGSVYVADTMDVMRLFSSRLSYNKGAYLLHMLRWVVGEEVFFTAVKNYVNDPMLAYRFATIDDLIWHLESVYGEGLVWFFEQWYYGEGFPTYGVNIAQLEEDGQIKVTLFQEQSHPSVEFFEMPVPIEIYSSGESKTLVCNSTFSGESFLFPNPGFELDSARFDPDQWLLARLDFMNVGIDEIDDSSMTIRPNPAKESIKLFIPNQKIGDVQIIDFRGKVLIEESYDAVNQEIFLDISGLPVGLYLVIITSGYTEYHGKFVKR